MPSKTRPDRLSIELFAAFFRQIGRPVSGVESWPEDLAQGDIDAIIGPYAVQHTSIDTLPEGRAHDVRFSQAIDRIEDDFRGKLGFRLAITFPWGSVNKGHSYKSMNTALREWLAHKVSELPIGHHHVTISDVPFPFDVVKGGPIKYDGPQFMRYDPRDQSLSARLRAQVFGDGHDKLTPLLPYRARGLTTLLLLESSDVALMSAGNLVQAFEAAFPTWPNSVDELWFLHRASPTHLNFHDLCTGHMWIFEISGQKIISHSPDGPNVGLWQPTAAPPGTV